MSYRIQQVDFEAVRFTDDNIAAVAALVGAENVETEEGVDARFVLVTPAGRVTCAVGDWVLWFAGDGAYRLCPKAFAKLAVAL